MTEWSSEISDLDCRADEGLDLYPGDDRSGLDKDAELDLDVDIDLQA
jgi:hypothetical protein